MQVEVKGRQKYACVQVNATFKGIAMEHTSHTSKLSLMFSMSTQTHYVVMWKYCGAVPITNASNLNTNIVPLRTVSQHDVYLIKVSVHIASCNLTYISSPGCLVNFTPSDAVKWNNAKINH